MIKVPPAVVRVELVDAWWASLVPVAAVVLSLLSIGLTLWFRYSDRLRLHVELSWLSMLDNDMQLVEGADRISVEVTNRSRTATTQVTSLSIQFTGGKTFAYMNVGPGDDELPVVLGPGGSASMSFPMKGMGISLNHRPQKPTWTRAVAVCGHRKVLGKKDRKMPAELMDYARKYPHGPGRSGLF